MDGAANAGTGPFDRLLALVLLAAGLSLLATALRPPAVALRWESGSEQDVAAYNLYRERLGSWTGSGEEPDSGADTDRPSVAPGPPINEAPIPAKGHASQGARYSFRDTEVVWGAGYRYRIEELNSQGQGRLLPDAIEVTVADHRIWQGALGLAALAMGVWSWRGAGRTNGSG